MHALIAWLILVGACGAQRSDRYFKIVVVDDQTNRGVPLVELRTTNEIRYWTDSNGVVAFYEPGLMGRKVFFHVASHGYEFPADGFGYRGRALEVVPGGQATLSVRRTNVAQRLYRVTGAGIYRDSILAGHPVPTKRPLLNGLVFGSDSVLAAVYRGRVYWFWGDTNRPSYPLGNFHVPGATSLLPGDGGLDPEKGVDLEYFLDERGFAKETARMPGRGPTWLGGLVALTDPSGRERLFAGYVKVAPPMRIYERGLVEFDDQTHVFRKRAQFPLEAPLFPTGHPFQHEAGGEQYIYFAHSIPPVRVRATPEALADPSRYEAFTCLKRGGRKDSFELDRDARGQLRWGWKPDTAPLTWALEQELVRDGALELDECIVHLQEADTGRRFRPHGHSVAWNPFRRRWVMIVLEQGGSSSFLGEVWYAEADTPIGPWVYARKVVTHHKYSFYNPRHHPMFDKDGGRVIFFEGTYSTFLSGVEVPTPRYNYNQIMYKLDLADPRLVLPVPVYRWHDPSGAVRLATRSDLPQDQPADDIPFFALDRPSPGAVALVWETTGQGVRLRATGAQEKPNARPLFYALPADVEDPPATTVLLFQRTGPEGQTRYATGEKGPPDGFPPTARAVCRVWRNPIAAKVHWR
ncbi:MAG TPA: hypothetical protein EYH34_18065 [Planctomycetes bacterium]|nr:hypothetical protein [Planctomycetota bacterium]